MSIKKIVFNFTGANQTFIVPPFVDDILVKAWGAGGANGVGSSNGGPGGYSTGTLPTSVGNTLTIMVGRGGLNKSTSTTYGGGGGGGLDSSVSALSGCSGGGRSGIAINAGNQVIIAGGGGGAAGGTAQTGVWSNGGSGGGTTGTNGWMSAAGNPNAPGLAGNQVTGGAGGIYITPPNGNGLPGSSLLGGQGGITNIGNTGAGGGGGGGLFGGGGGAGQFTNTANPLEQDAAGGGGSGYIDPIVLNGSTLATAQNTTAALGGPRTLPPNLTDPDYITGIGVGGNTANAAGGNGLVVLIYNQPDLILTKSVDHSYSDVNTPLTYTISVQNTGVVTVTDITFIDTLPNTTSYITNSLTLDGLPVSGTPQFPGITIPSIAPGATSTVQFQVQLPTTIPTPNTLINSAFASYAGGFDFLSNTVTTTINNATLTSAKNVNISFGSIGDTLTYTITINNSGNVTASHVLFIDTLPSNVTFIPSSFTQDGTPISSSPNPPGVTLPNPIAPNTITTITFKIFVSTLPTPNPILNAASANFDYVVDPSTTPNVLGVGQTSTNTVNTLISIADLSTIIKSTDKSFASCGDTIIYTITIPNTGNTTATNVIFKDTIPAGTTFIPGSLLIDGNPSASTPTNVNLGALAPGQSRIIQFSVIIQC